jgi:hypothetical protein
MDLLSQDFLFGIVGGLIISLLPFINRALDKFTSSKGARIGFIIVETIEALEDGKLTRNEVEGIIDQVRRYLKRLESGVTAEPEPPNQ